MSINKKFHPEHIERAASCVPDSWVNKAQTEMREKYEDDPDECPPPATEELTKELLARSRMEYRKCHGCLKIRQRMYLCPQCCLIWHCSKTCCDYDDWHQQYCCKPDIATVDDKAFWPKIMSLVSKEES